MPRPTGWRIGSASSSARASISARTSRWCPPAPCPRPSSKPSASATCGNSGHPPCRRGREKEALGLLAGSELGEGRAEFVQVAVLVLEHVGDGSPNRARRPFRPAEGTVQVLFRHRAEGLPEGVTRLHQLPSDAAEIPGGRRVRLGAADLVAVLLAQMNYFAGQRPADDEVHPVLAIDEMAEQLANAPAVAADGRLQVLLRHGVDDPHGLFALPLEGPQ